MSVYNTHHKRVSDVPKSRDRKDAAKSPSRRVGLDSFGLLDERGRLGDVAAEDVALDEVGEPDL